MKVWTKDSVEAFLKNFDHEAAKKHEFAFNYYLDDDDTYDRVERAVFIVWEWVRDDHDHNIKSVTVRGTKRMGWFNDAYDARKSREEYGDLGDHCLISEDEAREALIVMGLNIDDAKRFVIESMGQTNGHRPIILPSDPKWKARRDAERARLRLPEKE